MKKKALAVLVVKSEPYRWISLVLPYKKKKKSIEIEFARLMMVVLREP